MSLSPTDWSIVIFYFVSVITTGFIYSKKENFNDKSDYILAGRKITLPLFVATLVATWYGSILGVGEFVYNSGITAWLTLGVPYYIAALLFAFILSGKIRTFGSTTIPEQFSNSYGRLAGVLASIIVLVITIPAAYISMLGTLTSSLSGYDLIYTTIAATIISFVYIYHGGFKSDVYANVLQLILMYLAFSFLIFFCISELGSISLMMDNLPSYATNPLEKHSFQYLIVWYIIALQTFVDPSFHQRCAAATSPKTAKNGIIISVLLWLVFDMLTLFTGLYALAYIDISNPLDTYLVLGDTVLPNVVKGIFVAGLFATIMSTLSSYGFLSAVTIGNDLIKPYFKNTKSSNDVKIGLIITAIVGISISLYVPSVIDIFYNTASISIPGLLFPLLISYSSKFTLRNNHALVIMIVSTILSGTWLLLKSFTDIVVFGKVEPMLIGLLVSFILSLFFVIRSKH